MNPGALAKPGQWLQLSATILFATTLTLVLMLGMRRANQLQAASSALQLASQLSTRPDLVGADLTLLQRGLETTTYVGAPLRALVTLRSSSAEAFDAIRNDLIAAQLADRADVAAALAVASQRWDALDRQLGPLTPQHGADLYVDTPSGSALSAQGKAMKAQVDGLLAAQVRDLQRTDAALAGLGAILRTEVDDSGRSLRTLLLGGTTVAALLLGLMLYYAWRSRQAARAAALAQRQVANILGTVREGLFLLDRELRLGDTCSDSLRELLRLPSPAGRRIEEVLKPLVDAKTLAAAVKFLGLLWKDKVHEELIESVNPLSQIEVAFGNVHGGSDVRHLSFSFRRVRASDADYILGTVADVTDRVLLARELEHVRTDNDSQATLQLQLLRVEAAPLRGFLAAADVAFRKSNAVLTTPGIEQEDLKKKLNGVFRELHAVKGEAAALALSSFVQRIHTIEDALSQLRGRGSLSGNDFLPVVVKLDELINHTAQIRATHERVATLRTPAQPLAPGVGGEGADGDSHRDTTVLAEPVALQPPALTAAPGPRPGPGPTGAAGGLAHPLLELFRRLTQEAACARGCAVRLVARGLEDVPSRYHGVVKDICIQMIRNSVAHGIEPPEQRQQHGKPEEGTIQISFAGDDSAEDYLLTVEDDGLGLSYEQIVDKALRLDLITPQQAMGLDRAAVYRLIFQPGFSTATEVSEHAGRGVGLDAVSNLVREFGGRIGVSTAAGRFTRFKVLLPRHGSALASSAA